MSANRLLLLFSSQLFEAAGKKPILKAKWQKLINKFETAFILKLHAAIEKKSLKCVIKLTDIKSSPSWISYDFQTGKHLDKFIYKAIWFFSVSYRSIFLPGFM